MKNFIQIGLFSIAEMKSHYIIYSAGEETLRYMIVMIQSILYRQKKSGWSGPVLLALYADELSERVVRH